MSVCAFFEMVRCPISQKHGGLLVLGLTPCTGSESGLTHRKRRAIDLKSLCLPLTRVACGWLKGLWLERSFWSRPSRSFGCTEAHRTQGRVCF